MATKPDAAKPDAVKLDADEPGKKPVWRKKMLIIVIAGVMVLVSAGGGAFFFISKKRAAAAVEGTGGASAVAVEAAPKGPPVYLPLDNMVVNLADPGGEKVAQVGITLQVVDAHASESVKAYLPSIRSGVLMLISQRTAAELLTQEGKQKLAKDIWRETLIPFGGGEAGAAPAGVKKKAAKAAQAELPVVGVLFSSFIVQ
ncbi:flagellar basal body-associated protein FliL [Rhodoferax ferrireducens T118]|uniref:Flagellar protein FliL n=1 Tax=Albidiferax ferrireducens (strain ATCC BAA-621 / DSM 15236 / T118) TaxID=338969 RepID=Q221J6_ALBFT|nr:flagellar basal body-associated FliL family protein [Rhodoferax ferrireducens]ABD68307.1 flagellar basal body-associated protein FliL [Rhodoferax ferrireducens T118]